MSRFLTKLVWWTRSTLADFFLQFYWLVLSLFALGVWSYFDTVYAGIGALIVGVLIGCYLFGWIEGTPPGEEKPPKP